MEIQRGKYLRQVVASPVALISLVVVAGAAGVAGGIAAGAAVGAAAAGAAVIFWFLTVLGVAIRRANNAFYEAYAEQRHLRWERNGIVPFSKRNTPAQIAQIVFDPRSPRIGRPHPASILIRGWPRTPRS